MNVYDLIVYAILFFIIYKIVLCFKSPSGLKKRLMRMTPDQFEIYCTKLFRRKGYYAIHTKKSHDGGKDIILNGKTYVECKHYKGCVDRTIANKLKGVMVDDKIKKGIIITTGHFSRECLEYCKRNSIKCIDINDIIKATRRL